MHANLDALITALYVRVDDRGDRPRGPPARCGDAARADVLDRLIPADQTSRRTSATVEATNSTNP